MDDMEKRLTAFVYYAANVLKGDEKGEAQIFCERLFQAFGHDGISEAGARLEMRVKLGDGRTKFADLVWGKRVLIEMKKRGERLGAPKVFTQAREYWMRLTPKPQYVILCNFDEFWVYDFDAQNDEPMDRIRLDELPRRSPALNFLLPKPKKPLFDNDRREVTESAAAKLGAVFRALVARGESRERAQRFTLQCVVALFAEDTGLLPRGMFSELVAQCRDGESAYDLLGGLFRQMNEKTPARGGRYLGVKYFNGGIFANVDAIDLNAFELEQLGQAGNEDWSRINPAIFGTIFQASLTDEERHGRGAHYTHEVDIQRVVQPTIVRPFRERIRATDTLKGLRQIREELAKFRVLDPSCGSGNFLYVAFRELKRLELEVLEKIHDTFGAKSSRMVGASAQIQTKQFFGLDVDPFAVELAKVTLVLAKQLALNEQESSLNAVQGEMDLKLDPPLPFENLDENIRCDDALFCSWPKVDAIIGNPPFQSKNKMQDELGAAYVKKLRARYPDVPGRADYCVYWFRRAHDELAEGRRAGLVGTNTIRQNYSREGGLDYIVANGGTITEAVSTMPWQGSAVVHVSVANWVKGEADGSKTLWSQAGDDGHGEWLAITLERIPSSLADGADATAARTLEANATSNRCYQGQTHGHDGFLLNPEEARLMVQSDPASREVTRPYLTGDDLVGRLGSGPSRWVIDFGARDQLAARKYKSAFARVRECVLPDREAAAQRENERNAEVRRDKPTASVNHHHNGFLRRWWQLTWPRGELIATLTTLPRYVACSRVTKRPIFEFIASAVHPSDALTAFTLADDYSFGMLQSGLHWAWFTARCSTLKGDPRYTTTTVFDSFPWPQSPTNVQVAAVARAAVELRTIRRQLCTEHGLSLRQLYAALEDPGKHPMKDAHMALDSEVRAAYGMPVKAEPLGFLLALNAECAAKEARGETVVGPGVPPGLDMHALVTDDCVSAPDL